jgi:hypothetical protein
MDSVIGRKSIGTGYVKMTDEGLWYEAQIDMADDYAAMVAKLCKEGIDEDTLREVFSGLSGIILFDTLGEAEKNIEEISKLNFGLPILETKEIGLDNLKLVIPEAIERNRIP